jgi:hypothetical protein
MRAARSSGSETTSRSSRCHSVALCRGCSHRWLETGRAGPDVSIGAHATQTACRCRRAPVRRLPKVGGHLHKQWPRTTAHGASSNCSAGWGAWCVCPVHVRFAVVPNKGVVYASSTMPTRRRWVWPAHRWWQPWRSTTSPIASTRPTCPARPFCRHAVPHAQTSKGSLTVQRPPAQH